MTNLSAPLNIFVPKTTAAPASSMKSQTHQENRHQEKCSISGGSGRRWAHSSTPLTHDPVLARRIEEHAAETWAAPFLEQLHDWKHE
jgi:hypothetical protein